MSFGNGPSNLLETGTDLHAGERRVSVRHEQTCLVPCLDPSATTVISSPASNWEITWNRSTSFHRRSAWQVTYELTNLIQVSKQFLAFVIQFDTSDCSHGILVKLYNFFNTLRRQFCQINWFNFIQVFWKFWRIGNVSYQYQYQIWNIKTSSV